jgi:signal recognition particle subunit SRP54
MQEKMSKGEFGFDDFLKQMQGIKNMGGMGKLMKMMPGMGAMKGMDVDDKEIVRIEGMVNSMTKKERTNPDIIDASRRRRIARGCGANQNDVAGLIKTFRQTRQMMQAFSGMGAMGKMSAMKEMMNPEAMAAMMSGGGGGAKGSMASLFGKSPKKEDSRKIAPRRNLKKKKRR